MSQNYADDVEELEKKNAIDEFRCYQSARSASREPHSASREPLNASREPLTASREPLNASREPLNASREPPNNHGTTTTMIVC